MRWRPVDSTSVSAIGYEARRARLLVKFRSSGAVYAYHDVPRQVLEELEQASSKGRYVNHENEGRYRYEQVAPGRPRRAAPEFR